MTQPTLNECLLAACAITGVTPQEVAGKGRNGRTVLARELAVTLARDFTPFSYPEIALAFKIPNHSTVVTSHLRVVREPDAISLPSRRVRNLDPTFPSSRRAAMESARNALEARILVRTTPAQEDA